jgi:hypothetical protein
MQWAICHHALFPAMSCRSDIQVMTIFSLGFRRFFPTLRAS